MLTNTPFFKAFGALLFGRPARKLLEKIGRFNSLQELYELFGHLLPDYLLAPTEKFANSRVRIYTMQVTFWSFAAQILSPGTSCREIVRRVEAWWQETLGGEQNFSSSTSAYCQARARLDLPTLKLIHGELACNLERNVLTEERWLAGRTVKIVDGTALSMPDTEENQAAWPQPSSQKPGCGFPQMKLIALFSLSSGALLEAETSANHVHESTLFRTLWSKLEKGDILLSDRGFNSYATMAALQQRGVDSVMRLHQMRSHDLRAGRALGPEDRFVVWQKPAQCPETWCAEEFAALPETMEIRIIRLQVAAKGFRTKTVTLVTTLVDAVVYPAEQIRELYGKRWQVETHFQQIKTFLAMDVLRCKSPEVIRREVIMHHIAYNMVRSLMQRSAHLHHVPLARISFKGTLDTLRHWSGIIAAAGKTRRKQEKLIDQMLALIAGDPVPHRPGRSEPRAKKRRPKNYKLLNEPRHKIGNLPHRNRPKSKRPKPSLS